MARNKSKGKGSAVYRLTRNHGGRQMGEQFTEQEAEAARLDRNKLERIDAPAPGNGGGKGASGGSGGGGGGVKDLATDRAMHKPDRTG